MRSAGEMDQADAELRATICKVNSESKEIYLNLKYVIFSTADSIVNNWGTQPINRRLYSRIFMDPLDFTCEQLRVL